MSTFQESSVDDIINRRLFVDGHAGGNPLNFLELYGARMVEVTAFEPDPSTYRGEYYYNVISNRLYRRIITDHRSDGVIKAQWIAISQ